MKIFLRSIMLLIGSVALWQLLILFFHLPSYILPSPFAVLISFSNNFKLIITQAVPTIIEIILGLLLGIFLGCITALCMTLFKRLQLWLLPIVLISQALPTFVIAPLLVIWLGYGMTSKIIVTVLMTFFPVTSALFDGLRHTPSEWLDLAKIMNGKPWQILWRLRVPAALPHLATGIRMAVVAAPIGAIIGEWVGASQGLGFLMLNANARLQIDLVFACLFTVITLAIGLYFGVDKLLRLSIYWRPEKIS